MRDPKSDSRRRPTPKTFHGVMVSSTFKDLEVHREKIIDAINRQGMKAIAMEYDSAKPASDIIKSSMQMVHDCAGYVGIIGYRYGQVPECKKRNRQNFSITELEFREACRLKRPSVIFIMGENHPVPKSEFDKGPPPPALETFKRLAKSGRIYAEFENVEDLKFKAIQTVAELRWHLYLESEWRRQKGLLKLFQLAKSGAPIANTGELSEFEEAVLNHVSALQAQLLRGSPHD